MTKILENIGNTPLVQLKTIGGGRIFAKLEKTNPAGSIKDRAAYFLLKEAIRQGQLKPGMKIVEPTSGNTGIALAMIGKQLGYEVVVTMPSSMSIERRQLIASFGARIILVEEGGMQGAVDKADELVATGEYYKPDQFSNPANILAHEETTGPEIFRALPDLAGFIAGVGTGGTVSGVGRYLKREKPGVKIYALEPAESPLLSEGHAGPHLIQGIGANFVPKNFDRSVVDNIITVPGEEAIEMARRLSREEGLSVGISSGANLVGALQMAEEVDGPIVTVLPDLAERYMSTALFHHE